MLRRLTLLGLGLTFACGTNTPGPSATGGAGGITTGGTATGGTTSGGTATGGTATGGTATGGQSSAGTQSTGGASGGSAGAAGKSTSGGAATTGGTSNAGTSNGGMAGGGTTGGVANAGAGGSATGGAGGGSTAWRCPTGVTGKPTLGATPTRVTSVPPADAFNMNNGTFGNIEGPLWLGDALYVSEMSSMAYDQQNSSVLKSRILKVTADGTTSIALADSGSNGLAVDGSGNVIAAVHKDGSLTRFSLPGWTPSVLVANYMSARFNSPNDIAIRSDGNIYFSDPIFQAPSNRPQAATRVYRRAPNGDVSAIPSDAMPDALDSPNGVTLSLNEDWLYVASGNGRRYPIASDGTVGMGENYAPAAAGDGMVVDCAGNLYVAKSNGQNVAVYAPDGMSIGTIALNSNLQAVTNVAFGGADHKTLYITGLGNNKGLFKLQLDIPGRPY